MLAWASTWPPKIRAPFSGSFSPKYRFSSICFSLIVVKDAEHGWRPYPPLSIKRLGKKPYTPSHFNFGAADINSTKLPSPDAWAEEQLQRLRNQQPYRNLSADCPEATIADAYTLQRAFVRALAEAAIGAQSPAIRRHLRHPRHNK